MNSVLCPVCQTPLDIRPSRGRKSGKDFLMLICSRSGKHFRAFITDAEFVKGVTEARSATEGRGGGRGTAPPFLLKGGVWDTQTTAAADALEPKEST